jgi:hypothetical protein
VYVGTPLTGAERVTRFMTPSAHTLLLMTRTNGARRRTWETARSRIARRARLPPRKGGSAAYELVRQYEERHGRPPSNIERAHLAQQATLLTRRSKSADGESRVEALDR